MKPGRDHLHEFVVYKPCGCWGLLMSVDMSEPDDIRRHATELKKAQSRGWTYEFLTPAEWSVRGSEIISKSGCAECRPVVNAPPKQEGLPL